MNADALRILQTRTDQVAGYCYKLHRGQSDYGPLQFGMDVPMDDGFIDEQRMAVRIPFANGNSRDGVGDVLEVEGIDTGRHVRNPIVLFNHGKAVELPIALAEDPDTGQYTVAIDTQQRAASLTAFFYQGKGLKTTDRHKEYEHAIFCEQLFDLVAQKMIRSGSIGYQVIDARPISPDYRNGTPQGLHLLRVLMLEGSLVVLPANQDTVRKVLSMQQVCGKSLSPMLRKSLEPYAPEAKVLLSWNSKDVQEKVPVPHGDMSETDVPPAEWEPGVGAKRMEVDFFPSSRDARQFHEELDRTGHQVYRVVRDSSGQWLVYWETETGKDMPTWRGEKAAPEQWYADYLERETSRTHKPAEEGKRSHWMIVRPNGTVKEPDFYGTRQEAENHASMYGSGYFAKPKMMTNKSQPSDDIDPDKAEQILEDGEAHGKPLTEDQRRMFEAAASQQKNLESEPMDDVTTNDRADDHLNLPDEPMGAKAIRRMYADAKALHKEWSETLPVMADNPNIKTIIEDKLKSLQGEMKLCQKCWKKEKAYKDLEPLDPDENGEGETSDDDVVETPEEDMPAQTPEEELDYTGDQLPDEVSAEEVEPTPEEVVEGMSTAYTPEDDEYEDEVMKSYKRLRNKKIKSLLATRKRAKALKAAQRILQKSNGKAKTKDMDDETGTDDEQENVENVKTHRKRHAKRLAEGMAFLKQLAEEDSQLTEEDRMKAYHYAKAWEDLSTSVKGRWSDGTGWNDNDPKERAAAVLSMRDEEGEGPAAKMADGKCGDDDTEQIAPFKSLSSTIGFLKKLSTTKDFGARHRIEAKYWHRQLEEESADEEEDVIGSMDEKSLATGLHEQNREIEELKALIGQLV